MAFSENNIHVLKSNLVDTFFTLYVHTCLESHHMHPVPVRYGLKIVAERRCKGVPSHDSELTYAFNSYPVLF